MAHRKINSLQLLRALAVSLVVFIHASYYGVSLISKVNPIDSFYNLKYWGAIGVDLFFAISGFIMTVVAPSYAKDGGWKTFLLKRFIRIVPLYYLVSAVQAFNLIVVKHLHVPLVALIKTIFFFPIFDKGLIQSPILGVGWTLSYEVYFYVLVCLALFFKKEIFRNLLIIVAVLSICGYVFNPAQPFLKFLLSPLLLEFGLGILVGELYKKLTRTTQLIFKTKFFGFILITIGLCLMGVTIFVMPNFNIHAQASIENNDVVAFYRVIIWGIPSAIFMAGVIFFEYLSDTNIPKFFIVSGDASYSCYLIHIYVFLLAANILKHVAYGSYIFLIFIIPICLGVSILFYFFVEKNLIKMVNKFLS